MNRLAEALRESSPKVAAVIAEPLSDEVINDIACRGCIAEFRGDKFPSHEFGYLAEQIGRLAALPILLTIRLQAERSDWVGDEAEWLSLSNQLLPLVDGVDVGVGARLAPTLIKVAHARDKVVIASSHDFECTPSDETLENILAQAVALGADYTKIAASAKTTEEYKRLVGFTLRHSNDNVIVVAMDDYGPLSRIALPGIGSHLTYASTGETAVAPGQMGYVETTDFLARLDPSHSA